MKTIINEAKEIAKKYKVTLPARWKGRKNIWHAWHLLKYNLLTPMTYLEFINRFVAIGTQKPEEQRVERFHLMKPVKHIFRQKANTNEIAKAHNAECPDCKWDGTMLPQFDLEKGNN